MERFSCQPLPNISELVSETCSWRLSSYFCASEISRMLQCMVFFREGCLKARAIPENIIELQLLMLLGKKKKGLLEFEKQLNVIVR